MSDILLKSMHFPSLDARYIVGDETMSTKGAAADSKTVGERFALIEENIGSLSDKFEDDEIMSRLVYEILPGTIQTFNVGPSGNVDSIIHSDGATAVRTDTFTYSDSSIVETRTLSTGESLAISTNLETLATTVVYSAA